MKFLILSGGIPPTKRLLLDYIERTDILVGVDGAADFLIAQCIIPNVLVGDFDTAKASSVTFLEQKGTKIVKLQPEKNETDTEAAVNFAIRQSATKIYILGALGHRIDHELSNIMMLLRAHRAGLDAFIIDEINEMFVANTDTVLHGYPGQTVSILPLTADITVSAIGLKYPLENLKLAFGSSRGVSNIMNSTTAHLEISGGYALIAKIK